MKSFLIVFVVLCTALYMVNGAEFTDCGSVVGKYSRVEVSDCDASKDACVLKRNSNVTITIDFELTDTVSEVHTVVYGVMMGVDVPFPLSNPDGCKNSGITCPLEKGHKYEYATTLPVLKVYPKVKVDVKWLLKNEKGDTIICVLIPAKIE